MGRNNDPEPQVIIVHDPEGPDQRFDVDPEAPASTDAWSDEG